MNPSRGRAFQTEIQIISSYSSDLTVQPTPLATCQQMMLGCYAKKMGTPPQRTDAPNSQLKNSWYQHSVLPLPPQLPDISNSKAPKLFQTFNVLGVPHGHAPPNVEFLSLPPPTARRRRTQAASPRKRSSAAAANRARCPRALLPLCRAGGQAGEAGKQHIGFTSASIRGRALKRRSTA